jgi:predicted outer membrane repeat protein
MKTNGRSQSIAHSTNPQANKAKRFGILSLVPFLAFIGLILLFWQFSPVALLAQSATPELVIRYAAPNGSGNTCTTAAPCTLQTAVTLSVGGDEVHAREGSYTTTQGITTLIITRNVTILGGYSDLDWDNRDPALYPSILNGNNGRVIVVENNANPVIDGFHVRNGSASEGAGIYVVDGSPTIRNNQIYSNTATNAGGGIFVLFGESANILFNDIYNNQATNGAGIFIGAGNPAASAFIEGNQIYNNDGDQGAGLYVGNPATAHTQNNMFYDNDASGLGGAIRALGNVRSWHNTIVANHADDGGGGIHIFVGSVQISNTIVASNTSDLDSSGIHRTSGTVTGDDNNIFNNSANVTFPNTITADPQFINSAPDVRNLHLRQNSPNVDAAGPSNVMQDIDQQARPDDTFWDIGADEFYPNIPAFSFTPPRIDHYYADRGTWQSYEHRVTNENSSEGDTYTFACANSQGWTVDCPDPQTVPLGGFISVTTQVSVPAAATALEIGDTTITATSTVSPELRHAVLVRTVVMPLPGVEFTPNYSTTTPPGEIITLTHTLTNTGDAPDIFRVTLEENTEGWAELVPTEPLIVPLGVGASAQIQVQVTVPPHAAGIIPNISVARATSQYDSDVYAEVEDTVLAEQTIGTRYARPTGNNRNNNCTQPTFPCQTVGHTIDQAVTNDAVQLGFGSYNVITTTQMNETIHLSGGWRHDFRAQDAGPTIIQPTTGGSFQLFTLSGAANRSSFDMLTLQGGNGASARGGAVIVNSGVQVDFEHVIFQGSTAERGGAVQVYANAFAIFDGSTFISNTATFNGGAVHVEGGTVILRNVLFNQNEASHDGGAIYVQSGSATLNFNTIVANQANNDGGAIYVNNNVGSFSLLNSALSDNTAANQGGAIFVGSGSVTGEFVNFFNNTPANVGSITISNQTTHPPDFVVGDPEFHLRADSLLVDARPREAGNPANELNVDFEGDTRPSDQGFDLGYDELAGCSVKRDSTIYGGIQEALDDPAAVSNLILVSGICRGVNTMNLGGQTISQTVHITGTESLVIEGGWDGNFENRRPSDITIIDPQGRGRAFVISGPVSVTLEFLTLVNGDAAGLGGGPAAEDAGGILYNQGAAVSLQAVTMMSGTAELGGALYNHAGYLQTDLLVAEPPDFRTPNNEEVILRGEVNINTASSNGGGFYVYGGTAVINGAMVLTNTAVNGGGIYHAGGVLTTTNSVFAANVASGDGGAVFNTSTGDANLLQSTYYFNEAGSEGGAIYNQGGDPITIRSNIFQSNDATTAGDAIFANNTADEDYNYYHDQSSPFGGGLLIGPDSINSPTPPGLIDPANGNFHLNNEAPAADQADPLSPVRRDFDDDPRPTNQGPDMGADEVAGCRVELNGVIYGSIQAAMADAQTGDTIRVSGRCSGVHPYNTGTPGGGGCRGDNGIIQTTVHIDRNVILQGGWNEEFTVQGEEVTVLDANELGRVIYIAPGVTATVESFQIVNGALSGANGNGAGICIDNASPTIWNNELITNTATRGAAIYSINSAAVIDGNRIHHNDADAQTPAYGGGVYVVGATAASIWNNFIYANTAQTHGAAFYSESGNHRFWHNTLVGNNLASTAGNQGAGVYVAAGNPQIRSNIFLNNNGPATDGVFGAGSSNPLVAYNDFYDQDMNFGGTATDDGSNLFVDPLLTEGLTLTLASPMLDAGDPAITLTHDFEDDRRPSHLGFDIGADEIGGCVARNLDDLNTIYGSVQRAVDEADDSGDTIQVDGICLNAQAHPDDPSDSVQNLFVDKAITIDGDWASGLVPNTNLTATLDALDNGRVLYVAPSGILTLTNIHLSNGDANVAGLSSHGGGIYNAGTLLLDNVYVLGNTAVNGGGLYNTANLTTRLSFIEQNSAAQGGGVYQNGGTAVFTQTNHIFNNSVTGNGGGVYQNSGTLWVDGNRLYENTAIGNGGGLYLAGTGTEYVRNNFIYRNTANRGGGLYNHNTDAPIWHNTFYRNVASSDQGAGLYSTPAILIHSNIVDFNNGTGIHVANTGADIDYNNVVANLNGNYGDNASAGPNDISLPPFYVNSFADNFHLRDDSPGVDEADPAVPFSYDIDDDIRPTNGDPDMGADEVNACLIRVVDPTNGTPHIFGVLQFAINFAESFAPGVLPTVEIARGECSGVRQDSQTSTWQVGSIREDLVFEGSLRRLDFQYVGDYTSVEVGTNSSRIIAGDDGRALYIHDGANPTFHHLAFVEGNAFVAGGGSNGGGILVPGSGSLQMYSSFVCASTAVNGGGLYIASGSVISDSYITGSTIGECWPAHVEEDPDNGAVLDVDYIFYEGNEATSSGGGLYNAGDLDVTNSGFLVNTAATGDGGGFYNTAADTRIINGIFYSNTAALNGAGLYNTGANLHLYHNTVTENSAGNLGGGIRSNGNGFVLNSSIINRNTAVDVTNDGLSLTSAPGAGALNRNNFYDDGSNQGFGDNPIFTDPLLVGDYPVVPSIDSPVLDIADPTLLDPGVPPEPLPIDFDARLYQRPDGSTDPAHNNGSVSPYQSDLGAFEYWKDFGCAVLPSGQSQTAIPGTFVTYTFNVINTGYPYPSVFAHGYTDTLTVTLDTSAGWGGLINGDVQVLSNMGWFDSESLTLVVDVPVDAQSGDFDLSTITCQSWSKPSRTATAQATTYVGLVSGIVVGRPIPPFRESAAPGEVLTFTHPVRNIGNETVDVVIRPDAGPIHASAVLLDDNNNPITETFATLASQQEISVVLEVTILDTALRGEFATPGVVAQQVDDPDNFGSESNNILILGAPATRYVALGGQDANNNCSRSSQPCGTINHAIYAAWPGDPVLVAEGTYNDSSSVVIGGDTYNQNVFIDKPIAIYGGYSTLDEFSSQQPITQATRLDGEALRRGVYITPGITVTLSGLFIENGVANTSGAPEYGGGVYNADSNLTITSTFFLTNSARYGAGLYHSGGVTLTVHSSVFADNQVVALLGAGGGIFVEGATAVLENNTFVANTALGEDSPMGYGGAVYVGDGGLLTSLNNIFSDNSSGTPPGSAEYITTTATLVNSDYNLYWNNDVNFITGTNSIVAAPAFLDAYYHIAATSPAKDAGTEDTSRAWLYDYELQARVQGPTIDMGADERVQIPDFTFTPLTQTAVITAAQLYTYEHVLENTGDPSDSYSLSMAHVPIIPGNWSYTLSPTQTGILTSGERVTVTLVISGNVPGAIDQTIITADSDDYDLVRMVTDTTTITFTPGVDIEASQTGLGRPAVATEYSHVLTNTGDGLDQFEISVSAVPTGWLVTVNPTQTGILDPGATLPFTVSVTPPAGTPPGVVHTATVEARSLNTLGIIVTDTLTDVTTVIEAYGLVLTPVTQTRTIADGGTAVYTHTLQNVGNIPDTADLTVTGFPSDWAVTVEPDSAVLAVLETAAVTVTVIAPAGSGGMVHTAVVSATSQGDPAVTATAVDTTTVESTFGVQIEPDYSRIVDAPSLQTYTHTVTNLGDTADVYDLTAVSDLTWTTNITPGSIALDPGEVGVVTVTVAVPPEAQPGETNVTAVRAESQSDPAVFDTATDTTRVRQIHSLIFEPDRTLFADPNTDVVFTHYLTNTGNGPDSFVITADTENNWPVAVPSGLIMLAPGAGTTVLVTQSVPLGANGMIETMWVTATSTISPAVSASVEDTTRVSGTAGNLDVIIEPDNAATGNPGDTLTYQHLVTNTGDLAADFALSAVSENGWSVNVAPTTAVLAVDEAAPVTVTVTIPLTASTGSTDVVTVTAVAQAQADVFDTALDTTTVMSGTGSYDVVIEPDNAATADPGDTVTYNHLVTNTGTLADEYEITAVSSQGWAIVTTPGPGESFTLTPGQSASVLVRVTVPGTAGNGAVDVTTVTVSSTNSPATDLARDTTTVQAGPPTIYLPIIMKPSATPPTPTPTPTTTPVTPTPTPTPCAPPTGVDLIVTEIQVVPLVPTAGQPATVFVTIRNQGTVNVPYGNNFFLDFYVDRVPQPYLVGNIVWGVQGAHLTAGTSRTYQASYTFNGGTHQLYAQVDTDRHVNECPNEDNNTLGPINLTVTGEPSGAGESIIPQYGPRQTPTPEPLQPTATPASPFGTPTLPSVEVEETPAPTGTPNLSSEPAAPFTPTPTP